MPFFLTKISLLVVSSVTQVTYTFRSTPAMCLSRFFSVPRIRFIFVHCWSLFYFHVCVLYLCSFAVNWEIEETASCRLLLFFPMSRFSTMFTLCVTHLSQSICLVSTVVLFPVTFLTIL